MTTYLLITAVVIFACVFLSKVSSRLGIPMLLAFILLGMLFGSDGILKIPFDNYAFAEQICTVALIFIMFYGGFGTNWQQAKSVAVKAGLLSTAGVVITTALTGVFCHYALHIAWVESMLIGALIGSTDAASVFSVLRSKRLSLRYNTASLLEVESGSNDPCAYMLTVTFIAIAQGSASGGQIGLLIVKQMLFGILFGGLIAAAAVLLLKKIKFSTAGFDMVFVVGIAVIGYALPAVFGGNGFLSVYIVGIVLGNTEIRNKRNLVNFFDGLTGLMQMLIFFLLGLLAFPSRLPQVVIPALLIAVFLTFVARPVAVALVLTPFKGKISQQLLVSWAGLRGAASIVFAIMAEMAVETENDVFHIVFMIVLFSILLQGSLLPLVAKKLDMIDEKGDVMKTFNDYSDEVPVQFIQLSIPKSHHWCGKTLKELTLPPETLVVLLKRNGENIIPNGDTRLLENDVLVLSATSPDHVEGVSLVEIYVDENSKYNGKLLSEIPKKENTLVIMIQRGEQVIIPHGNIRLESGDMLVVSKTEICLQTEIRQNVIITDFTLRKIKKCPINNVKANFKEERRCLICV